ncbi:MAG: GlgB N-terminal domain-containing protein, partial [Snowella sp.]
MSTNLTQDQVNQIVYNLHHDPFEILGSHPIETDGTVKQWVIRAYLPDAQAAWVAFPSARKESPMHAIHHANFFECKIATPTLNTYQFRI